MRPSGIKAIVPVFFSVTITAVCLFAPAGTLHWPNAWVLLALSFATGLAFTAGRDSEMAAERRNVKDGKNWDKLLAGLTVLLGPMAMWITAGFDERFHWSTGMSPVLFYAGVLAALLGAALSTWAMRSNRFFSPVVRIQKDRGHRVVDGGPYGFVRHPGYAGMSLFALATPLILGSYWALAPAAATAAASVIRTVMEDGTLQKELEGYSEYTCRVRYRLLPSIW